MATNPGAEDGQRQSYFWTQILKRHLLKFEIQTNMHKQERAHVPEKKQGISWIFLVSQSFVF